MVAMSDLVESGPSGSAVEVRLKYRTEEGLLNVRARRTDGRWVVEARCGNWRQISVGTELAAASDAALAPYASGQSVARRGRSAGGRGAR